MEEVDYEYIFMVAALLMGGTHLLFLFGYPGYRLEELSGVNNLRMIYRVCKAAFGKRKSKYPATANSYYWKNYKQGHLYERGEGKGQRLYPKVPRLFRWLDKAAIIEGEECSDPKEQEKKGNLCMVKEVREVKSLVPMIYLCFSIFGYSLLSATGTTFFVSQVDIMTPVTRSGDNWILFLIWDGMARFICFIIKFSFRRRLKTFKRKAGSLILGFGLLSAVSCSLVAWRVEARRLSIIHIENGDLNQGGRNTTMALVPQFVLIGIADGLVEGGLRSLFQGTVANSLLSLVGLFIEMVIGTGKLLIIPVVFIFSFWIKETINTSHLDRYYLMLGILNAVFLIVYGYYSIRYVYKEVWSVDEEVTVEHPDVPPVHQPNTNQENDNNDMQQDLLQENDDNDIQLEVEIDQTDLFQENNDNEAQLVVNQPDSHQENDDEAQLLDQPDSHQENDDNEENLLDQVMFADEDFEIDEGQDEV
ncbi:hypothetical protein Fmac_012265 [Flemingia macrophylla]|uniref:Uncharacterized protein n=1 Tax=Flemingia macrophylla TaxID=520843 RepID=A0ABD1MPU5_9FABA